MPVRLLLIEDNPGDAVIFREKIDASPLDTTLVHVVRLKEALERLRADAFDLVFVDLSLPDTQGLDTVDRVREAAPHLPLIVLTGLDDATAAAEAKKRGAVDYLVKWYVDSVSLARYVRYAIEQYRMLGPQGGTTPAARHRESPAPPAPLPPPEPPRAAVEEAAAEEETAAPARDDAVEPGPAAPDEAPSPPPAPSAGEAALVPALEAALTVAQETAARAEHLAGSLGAALDLARGTGAAPAPEPLDVLPLVQQAVDRARARALHAGIPVRLRAERKRVFAVADRQALGQAVERLLALALGTGCGSGVRLGTASKGARTTLRADWELRGGARLEPSEDPLLGLDLSLCRRLAARAGGVVTLREDGREAAVVLTFEAPSHG